MNTSPTSRRDFLCRTGALGAVLTSGCSAAAPNLPAERPPTALFRYSFNTGTILGRKLGIVREIEIASRAGYDAIEPWIRSLQDYVQQGGSLRDLRRRIADAGLAVESAIDFSPWIVEDSAARAKGLEQVRRAMDILAQIGGKRIAAPPAGATRPPSLDLLLAAERYRRLLEIGDQMGVVPQLELWGFSHNLHRLGQVVFVVLESGHPRACFLPDVYHIYKGGSDHLGLKQLSPHAFHVLHMNDYPADPPREKIADRDRVMPGDGIAPLSLILRNLHENRHYPVLSLELFNPAYWKKDPLEVARLGLEKMKAAVRRALA